MKYMNFRGGIITVVGQSGRIIVQLLSLVIMSRLLLPSDFGVMALVLAVVAAGELIRDFGLSSAAMQAAELDRQQRSNLFWINLALGTGLFILVVFLSPLIGIIFRNEHLPSVLIVTSVIFLLNGAQAQILVELARAGRFSVIALTDVASQVIALATAVLAAGFGYGYWSLAIQVVTAATISTASRWFASHWLPGLPTKDSRTREFLIFGRNVGVSQLLSYAASNVDTFSLGLVSSASGLGFYNRAFQMVSVPVNQLLNPLTNVALPALARSRNDRGAYMLLLTRAQALIGYSLSPLVLVAAGASGGLVPLLLGPGWNVTQSSFVLLAIGSSFHVLEFVIYWAFLSDSQTRALVWYNVVIRTISVILIVLGATFVGIIGVAAAVMVSLMLSWPVSIWFFRRASGLPVAGLVSQGLRILSVAACAGGAAWLATMISSPLPSAPNAGIGVITGVLVAVSALLVPVVRQDTIRALGRRKNTV